MFYSNLSVVTFRHHVMMNSLVYLILIGQLWNFRFSEDMIFAFPKGNVYHDSISMTFQKGKIERLIGMEFKNEKDSVNIPSLPQLL